MTKASSEHGEYQHGKGHRETEKCERREIFLAQCFMKKIQKGPRCSATCHRGFTEGGQPASSGVQEDLFLKFSQDTPSHSHEIIKIGTSETQRHRTSGNHGSHVRWHLSQGCRKCPGDLPQEVPFMTGKKGPDYISTCAQIKR